MHFCSHRENEDLNAEEVAAGPTPPVFGKRGAGDVPNPIFLEQKKIFKIALTLSA